MPGGQNKCKLKLRPGPQDPPPPQPYYFNYWHSGHVSRHANHLQRPKCQGMFQLTLFLCNTFINKPQTGHKYTCTWFTRHGSVLKFNYIHDLIFLWLFFYQFVWSFPAVSDYSLCIITRWNMCTDVFSLIVAKLGISKKTNYTNKFSIQKYFRNISDIL